MVLSRRHGWTREDSFVSLSRSDNCPQIVVRHKLFREINGGQSGIDERSMRENFKDVYSEIERLKDLQREASEKLVDSQDVVLIHPTGSGKFESCGARTSDN